MNMVQAHPVEFTVHHATGGPSDRVTRLLASEMSNGRYLVVNRPGAGGRVAIRQLLSRPAMMIATMPQIFVTNPMLFADLDYDPEIDLELIAVIAQMPNILVCNTKLGFRTVADLKSTPKSLNFAVAGMGSNEHIATSALLGQWKNDHVIVAYAQGGNSSLIDLLAGNIDCMFANYPLIKSSLDDRSRIIPLLSSHAVSATIPTWQQTFAASYPVTSQLGLIVSRQLDTVLKDQIRSDIEKLFGKTTIAQEISDLGLIPILKTDTKSLAESRSINARLREFILSTRLKLK